MEYPRLRYLEAFPLEHEGLTQVVLRDPMQISPQMLALSPELYSLLALFDGRNSLLDIQAEAGRLWNRLLFRSELEAILKTLDQAFFLDNENFRKRLEQVTGAFRRDTVRTCSHKGVSYPAEPLELREQISSFYEHPEGAGRPAAVARGRVRGLLAPHILQHLYGGQKINVLPVLASFSYRDANSSYAAYERTSWLECFLAAFQRAEHEYRGRVCLIASADLAHIGPRYGDRLTPDIARLEEVTGRDREMLAHVCAGDGDAFRSFIENERDSRRVCGFAPIYTVLRLAGEVRGRLLAHSHSVVDPGGSFVTYASLVLES